MKRNCFVLYGQYAVVSSGSSRPTPPLCPPCREGRIGSRSRWIFDPPGSRTTHDHPGWGVGEVCHDRCMSSETDDVVVLTDQRRYPHGVPSWVDVTQTDLDAAREFY